MTVSLLPAYKVYNAASPTTAAILKVASGTAITTQLQLVAGATKPLFITGWGYTVDAAPGGIGTIELIQTDVAATVTAHVAGGIVPLNRAGTNSASTVALGTAATGYTGSAEGTITATKVLDVSLVQATTLLAPERCEYNFNFETAEAPYIAANGIVRIRTTFATSGTNILCWIKWHE